MTQHKNDVDAMTKLQQDIVDRDKKLNAFYRNPYFLLTVGALVGIIVVGRTSNL